MRTLIVVVCIIALGATIGTIVIGSRSFEGTVVEKPYETGLDWDRTKQQEARLGWSLSIAQGKFKIGSNDLFFTVLDRDQILLRDATALVKVTRPSTVAYDKTYRSIRQPDGRYLAKIDLPRYGNWYVIVQITRGDDAASFTRSIFAERN